MSQNGEPFNYRYFEKFERRLVLNPVPQNKQFSRKDGINVSMDIFHIVSLSIFCFLCYKALVGIFRINTPTVATIMKASLHSSRSEKHSGRLPLQRAAAAQNLLLYISLHFTATVLPLEVLAKFKSCVTVCPKRKICAPSSFHCEGSPNVRRIILRHLSLVIRARKFQFVVQPVQLTYQELD